MRRCIVPRQRYVHARIRTSSWCIAMHRDAPRGENAHELKRSVTERVFFSDSVFRGHGWNRFFPGQRARRVVNHYLFLCFTLSSGGERGERGNDGTEREGKGRGKREEERKRERERAGESRMEEDASPRARSSNYYGFSGSNSPDGNTTQFTHADCAREDVNSCQSDGPFHLLFFAGAPNRHRGRRAGRLFGFPLSPRLFFALPPFPLPSSHPFSTLVSRTRASVRCFVSFKPWFYTR